MARSQIPPTVVTSSDALRLKQLLEGAVADGRDHEYLDKLEEELESASVVSPEIVPPDVVTLNSQISIKDMITGDESTFTLVMPRDADVEKSKISIMAPLGIAVLGQRIGDIVKFCVPAGVRKIKICRILYQPEAAGDYQL
jgi:regulator of nucleoside diphosphate kinase